MHTFCRSAPTHAKNVMKKTAAPKQRVIMAGSVKMCSMLLKLTSFSIHAYIPMPTSPKPNN